MDRELKKFLRRILLMDSLFTSSSSLGSVFDDIEDELEDMFGNSKNKSARFIEWLKSDENDDENF